MALAIIETSFNLKEGHEYPVQPESLSKTDLSLREAQAIAAPDGQYHSEPFMESLQVEMCSSSIFPRFSGGTTKPMNSSNVNKAKIRQDPLNREYSP